MRMKKGLLTAATLGLAMPPVAFAVVSPNGPEFQVNTYTTARQSGPAVGVDGGGDFVVVWTSEEQDGSDTGIFGQRFDSSGKSDGAEFMVNSYTSNEQGNPAIGINTAGDFVVVWRSHQDGSYGIFGQRFDNFGRTVGAEFQVNTYSTSSQSDPDLGMNADGDFVVAWESYGQDGSGWGIFGQRFDSSGSAVGAEFQVNSYSTSSQLDPAVGIEDDGSFVVAWVSYGQDGSPPGIFGQRFSSSGILVGVEFQINSYTTSFQNYPDLDMDSDGDFVVVWSSASQDGSGYGVFGQRFDSMGNPSGAEFRVNTYTNSHQTHPAVDMDGDGHFVVAWWSNDQDGSGRGVFAQKFDNLGFAVDWEIQINTFTSYDQWEPAVYVEASGGFMVAWTSGVQDGFSAGVFGQRVLADGLALTSPTPADTLDCASPALLRPTITWEIGDYDLFKIFMGSSPGFEKGTRVTSGDKGITTSYWTPNKKKWKRACNKAIGQAADPNHPVMYMAVQGKDRDLSKSDPLRMIFSFPVRTEVQP